MKVDVITSVYEIIKKPLPKIFHKSIVLGIFPQNMKIVRVTPLNLAKTITSTPWTNFRSFVFSKILERIMYKEVCNYLSNNNLLFHKEFGFRKGHSTDNPLFDPMKINIY